MSTAKTKPKRTQAWRKGAVAAISLAAMPLILHHLRTKLTQDPRNDDDFIVFDDSDLSGADRRTVSNFLLNANGDNVHKNLSMLGEGIRNPDFPKAVATIQNHFKKRKPAEKRDLELVGMGFMKSLRPNRKKFTRGAKILGASALGAALLLHPKSRDVLSTVVNDASKKVKGFKSALEQGLNSPETADKLEDGRYFVQNVSKTAKRKVEDMVTGKPDYKKRIKRDTQDFKDFSKHKVNQSKSWIASNILD